MNLKNLFNSLFAKKEEVRTVFDDRVEYRVGNNLHRDNGPAVERNDGTKEWFRNGKRHRMDGPAIERGCGCKAWWVNGTLLKTEGEGLTRVNDAKTFNRHFG